MDKKIVIIGAGPCGLGAAWRLQQLGYKDWQIYERNDYVGGLSASFKDEKGFVWDIGGHVIFSHYEYFDKLLEQLLGRDYIEHQRKAYIRVMNRWVPYPFQNNIRYLPKKKAWECLSSLFMAGIKNRKSYCSFSDWILAKFGKGIAKYFMFPHNLKVWNYPLEGMSYNWIGERVSVVDFKKVLGNFVFGRKDTSWGPNSTFKFPLFGGTGEIFRRFIPYIKERLFLNQEIVTVDIENKEVILKDGNRSNYDILINTMPLDKFIKAAGLTQFFETIEQLKHNSVLVVGLGFKKSAFSDKCWVYFPESNCPFYRITYFSNYSPCNVPNSEYSSLICEAAYSQTKPYKKGDIVEDTIAGLTNSGILTREDKKYIVSTYLINAEYAYPIPTLGRDEALNTIQPYLVRNSIYSRGRFGAWRYELGNTDYSLMQGVEAVNEILGVRK
jgi:protoporphyrinogen oxidase